MTIDIKINTIFNLFIDIHSQTKISVDDTIYTNLLINLFLHD